MTNKQLIEELKKYPDDAEVHVWEYNFNLGKWGLTPAQKDSIQFMDNSILLE